jgi:hypothetical protein
MPDITVNHSKSSEVINIAGQDIRLTYLTTQGYWVAIKYTGECEIFTGVTREDVMENILNGLKCLN